jgi:hypothetical protein
MPSASANGQQVTPQAGALAELTVLTAVGGTFHLPTLRLNTSNVVVTPQTPVGSLTEPTFTGYAPVVGVTWGTPENQTNGGGAVFAPSETMVCSGGTPADTIRGWFLTDSGGTTLLLYVPLAQPVQIAAVGDGVTVQPVIALSGQ